MWKVVFMALFEVMLFQRLLHGTEENKDCQNNWLAGIFSGYKQV
jgi:hypothetical protein